MVYLINSTVNKNAVYDFYDLSKLDFGAFLPFF